jgi:hypothetical protein
MEWLSVEIIETESFEYSSWIFNEYFIFQVDSVDIQWYHDFKYLLKVYNAQN